MFKKAEAVREFEVLRRLYGSTTMFAVVVAIEYPQNADEDVVKCHVLKQTGPGLGTKGSHTFIIAHTTGDVEVVGQVGTLEW